MTPMKSLGLKSVPRTENFKPCPAIQITESPGSNNTRTYTLYHHLPHLLEVDELGLVCVEVKAGAVVADGWWAVFELLRHIFDDPLAVHAQETPAHLQQLTFSTMSILPCMYTSLGSIRDYDPVGSG